ncbi:MAG: DUF1467 family protein [Bauldia sp.]
MNWLTLAAIYFVVWWLCLFIILPIGVRSQAEDSEGAIMGTTESAPARPRLLRRALATTVLAAVVVGVLYYANANWGLTLENVSRMFGQ